MAATSLLVASGAYLLAVFFLTPLTQSNAYKFFSTKTPYEWMHPPDESNLEDRWLNEKLGNLLCTAVHTSIVARHGTRYPGQEDVQKINEIYRMLQATGADLIPSLTNWKNPFPDNDQKALAHLGELELERFGRRTAQRLFSLFAEEDVDSFRYIISSKERTRDSAHSFFDGFINVLQEEENEDDDDDYEPEIIDKLLRFHALCDSYVKSVGENKTALKEYYSFQSGPLVTNIKNKITKKLGVPEETLDGSDIRTIYLMCGYEAAIFSSSPWCDVFDEDDMRILEYLGDLKHYYKNGAAYDITWKQACPLVSDMFYTMDDAIDAIETMDGTDGDDGYIIGQFAFGHAETLGPLLTALGLFNDSEPLRADNFDRMSNRVFRSSNILPFGANVQLVLYECEPEDLRPDDTEQASEYHLKLLVNEKPVVFPGCSSEICPYTTIRERLKEQVDNCNFVKTCRFTSTKDEL